MAVEIVKADLAIVDFIVDVEIIMQICTTRTHRVNTNPIRRSKETEEIKIEETIMGHGKEMKIQDAIDASYWVTLDGFVPNTAIRQTSAKHHLLIRVRVERQHPT